MCDSVRPHPWDSPGKNTGVGCHFLLQCIKVKSEKWKWSRSVMSDSSQPHGLQPTRLLRPWDFPGKRTKLVQFGEQSHWVRGTCSQWSRNSAVRCIPINMFVYTRSHSRNVHNSIVYNNEIFKQLVSINSRLTWYIHIMEKYTVMERNEDSHNQ